jgi:hypothetical protein
MTMMVTNRKIGVSRLIFGMNDGSYHGLPLRLIRQDYVIIPARKGAQRQMNTPAATAEKIQAARKRTRKESPLTTLSAM